MDKLPISTNNILASQNMSGANKSTATNTNTVETDAENKPSFRQVLTKHVAKESASNAAGKSAPEAKNLKSLVNGVDIETVTDAKTEVANLPEIAIGKTTLDLIANLNDKKSKGVKTPVDEAKQPEPTDQLIIPTLQGLNTPQMKPIVNDELPEAPELKTAISAEHAINNKGNTEEHQKDGDEGEGALQDVLNKGKASQTSEEKEAFNINQSKETKSFSGLVDSKLKENMSNVHLGKEGLPSKEQLSVQASPIQTMAIQTLIQTTSLPGVNGLSDPAAMNINAYPGKAGWNQEIGQRVVWMVGAAEQTATLTLNPPDLGPLQVVINVNNEKADTTFISENPVVRKALEEGIPELRNLMNQAGVTLGQTNVNTQSQQQAFQQTSRDSFVQKTLENGLSSSATTQPVTQSRARAANGLVDTFA